MKFGQIKQGDTVLRMVKTPQRRFFLPIKVDRVTKTQIIIGNKKFLKKDGSEYPREPFGTYIYFEGDENKDGLSSKGVIVTDQSEEYKEWALGNNIRNNILQIVELHTTHNAAYQKVRNLDLPKEKLSALLKHYKAINEILIFEK